MADEILDYYAGYDEDGRLGRSHGRLEYLRTMAVLARALPPAPAEILDIGGGPGAYAVPLTAQGYAVRLVDLTPVHIEQALARADAADLTLAGAEVGDACALAAADQSADATLLMGPLYHLQSPEDRAAAWREAFRVTRPGGVVIAAAISRYASAVSGIQMDALGSAEFRRVVAQDLATGRHDNPTQDPALFTTAYFHRPDELRAEAEAAGLEDIELLGVEGPACVLPDLSARLDDPEQAAHLLAHLAAIEAVPWLLGVSFHMLAVGRRAQG
jgi:SAM-dependent methyltransferase